MKIRKADIFKEAATHDAICVTTNGIVKRNGALVMGAGVAKQFTLNFPGIEYDLGAKVKVYGNQPFLVYRKKTGILSFPTKDHYKDKSNLTLIKSSAEAIVKLATARKWTSIAIPAPGVGLGGLSWSKDVQPLLESILDNRFTIYFKP